MCGIAGVLGVSDKKLVEKMTRSLEHRGPDDEGYYVDDDVSLGHRRLSIIDLNTGKQPIFNEEKSVLVILNGEIYNYKEKRGELEGEHDFYTNTDTEVIVHLYEKYGLHFVKHLEGMFALAIYDIEKKRLVLARDHLGIKPLFYSEHDSRLIFGSEMKALFTSGMVKSQINLQAIKERYVFGDYILGDKTLFKDIVQLTPGNILVAEEGDIRKIQYAGKNYETSIKDENKAKRRIGDLLRESVESRLMSDVPLGTLLSGGLDSSIIAALHEDIVGDEEVHTFSVTDQDGSQDSRNAKILAEHIGSTHLEFVFSKEDIIEHMPSFIYHEENINYGIMFSYFLSMNTKKHATVVLSGNGSDEVFAGYDRYKNLQDHKDKLLSGLGKVGLDTREYVDTIESIKTRENLLEYEQLKGQLSNFQLQWVDRTSMAFGLEVRVPFLNIDLVDYVNKVDMSLKIRDGVEKYVLREAVSELDMPDVIKKRPKLPAGMANTAPKAIPEFEDYCKKLVASRKKTEYDRYFKTPGRRIAFDLLNHIFVENNGSKPGSLSLNDLY